MNVNANKLKNIVYYYMKSLNIYSSTDKMIKNIKYSKRIPPQDDFYNYVNKVWCNRTTIPLSYSHWGITQILYKRQMYQLKKIIDNLKSINRKNRLLLGYYNSYMNISYRNRVGFEPIQPYLSFIEMMDNSEESNYNLVSLFLRDGLDNIFWIVANSDEKQSNIMRPYFISDGIGLDMKLYYSKKEYKNIRERYKIHMKRVFKLIGYTEKESVKIVKNVFNIEKHIAKHLYLPEEERIEEKRYNKVNRKKFFNKSMNKMLDQLGITNSVIIDNPKFYKFIEKLLKKDLKYYFIWRLLSTASIYLSEDFVNESFKFYKFLTGTKKQKKLWKRGISFVEGTVGELLGELYVKKHFPESSKKKVLKMVNNLKSAFRDQIRSLDWMENKTKTRALKKLSKFRVKIGYPNKFEKYEGVEPLAHPFSNVVQVSRYIFNKKIINRFEKPVDREEWGMLPHKVNAYFDPPLNEIVFPAGILQPPYFDPTADDVYNYGSIGATIGHEITHGYDDQGRKFDENGNLNNWWTKRDEKQYNKKANKIIKLYNNCRMYGKKVNGELTVGESIADLGGLIIAFNAMKKTLENKDYIMNAKKFLISYAFGWRIKVRKKVALRKLLTDEHPPARYRVNMVLYNFPVFHEVYCTRKGDKMYNDDFIKIW